MRKRILIIREYSGYGGIEYQIENIIFNLMEYDWKIVFLTNVQSPLTHKLKENCVKVVVQPFQSLFETAKLVNKICIENDISLVQAHVIKDSFACRIAKIINRDLVHIFRVHTYIDCSHIAKWKKNLYHLASWITNPLVNMYVPINEFNVTEMTHRTHISRKKIRVVHNVIRPLAFIEKEECAIKNGHIAMIANFVDFKGHDVLIEGMKILRAQNLQIVAHLYGSVPGAGTNLEDYRRHKIVKQMISDNKLDDIVLLHGYSANIQEAIKNCGIVVLPSDAEGTPNSLLQGIMLHKIIIASKVGGIPELIQEGVTGFLHEPRSPQAFADAVIKAYSMPEDELKKIAIRAAKQIEDEYNINSVINKLLQIYDELCCK